MRAKSDLEFPKELSNSYQLKPIAGKRDLEIYTGTIELKYNSNAGSVGGKAQLWLVHGIENDPQPEWNKRYSPKTWSVKTGTLEDIGDYREYLDMALQNKGITVRDGVIEKVYGPLDEKLNAVCEDYRNAFIQEQTVSDFLEGKNDNGPRKSAKKGQNRFLKGLSLGSIGFMLSLMELDNLMQKGGYTVLEYYTHLAQEPANLQFTTELTACLLVPTLALGYIGYSANKDKL